MGDSGKRKKLKRIIEDGRVGAFGRETDRVRPANVEGNKPERGKRTKHARGSSTNRFHGLEGKKKKAVYKREESAKERLKAGGVSRGEATKRTRRLRGVKNPESQRRNRKKD